MDIFDLKQVDFYLEGIVLIISVDLTLKSLKRAVLLVHDVAVTAKQWRRGHLIFSWHRSECNELIEKKNLSLFLY